MTNPSPQPDENVSPRTANVYVGSSVADAFHDAMRRWRAQRDSDPHRLSTHDLVEQAFGSHGLRIETEATLARPDKRPVHVITAEHRRIIDPAEEDLIRLAVNLLPPGHVADALRGILARLQNPEPPA